MALAAISYEVQIGNLHAHLFSVSLTIERPTALQKLSLPVWIPGSYLVREFSKNLQQLQARQLGKLLTITQLDKCSWQIQCTEGKPLVLSYQIYAFDSSVRTAWLDATRGFFNGTSVFLRVLGQEDVPHALTLLADKKLPDWRAATGLAPRKINQRGFGSYLATDYDELVDSPVELGAFWSGSFVACGVPHRFVVAGAPPGFDGKRLLADTQKICEAEIRFWHGKPPHRNYVFMLNGVDEGYGGLEHRNSTALICKRKDLPRLKHESGVVEKKAPEGYTTLLGLISHEYFHTWNVKRLRPAEFTRFDYANENYTELLWFFEGFTSYYDDLLLHRSGLIDQATYLTLLGKTINQVAQTPGRAIQSVAQASFDAWVKYYRQDENTANATISYYTKGSLVALCLDLTLRQKGKSSLDAVMRSLWQRSQGGPMTEADLLDVLEKLSGRSFQKEISRWVHSCGELPLESLLEQHGVSVQQEPAGLAQRLGLRVSESAGVQIRSVLRGGAAELAGFAAGDEWLALETGSGNQASSWRLSKLDEVPLYAGAASKVAALVARDKRILKLSLKLPPPASSWCLAVHDKELVDQWLN